MVSLETFRFLRSLAHWVHGKADIACHIKELGRRKIVAFFQRWSLIFSAKINMYDDNEEPFMTA